METKIRQSILFVSKDKIYTSAITFIINLTYKLDITAELDLNGNLYKRFLMLNPDFVIVDLDTFTPSEIESVNDFKKNIPKASIIALIHEKGRIYFSDKVFENTIYKTKFYEGFTSILANQSTVCEEFNHTEIIFPEKNIFQLKNTFIGKRLFPVYNLANT